MSDDQRGGPPDLAAQVTALAKQVERAARQAETHQAEQRAAAARLDLAETDAAQLRADMQQTDNVISELKDQVRAMRGRPAPPALSYLDPTVAPKGGPPAPTSQQILEELATWLRKVYMRLPGPALPACWAYHPGAVDMLLALRMAHAEVYSARTGTWEKALNWHLRSKPDAAKRLSDWLGMCEIRQHIVGGPEYLGRDRDVPLAAFLDEVAAVWDDRRETPDPTALAIASCDRYVARTQNQDVA